jgi:hypothetical protein
MFKQFICIFIFISFGVFAQTSVDPSTEKAATLSPESELESLKKKVKELEEIQNENSEILKKQLSDLHYDQNSRGYIEIKLGKSMFKPEDIEKKNDEIFGGAQDAEWADFKSATTLEFEIGKTILENDFSKHEVGIGYQQLRSQADASYTPNGGGDKVSVYEKVAVHTIFARYARLFKASQNGKLFFGPGITLGYSPVSKMTIEVEQGTAGVQVSAESTSYLLEVFGKAKLEISRYFSLVATGGYRKQEANNLRLNAADLISIKTKVDLDASGPFGTLGIAVSF